MSDLKQIICVKWGTKYGPDYVNRLYGMVARNITGPFRFVCITDRTEGLRPEVETIPLPELGCPHPQRTFGQWRKVVLWGREIPGLTGVALFVDLDSVIVGNLDGYFSHGSPDDVIVARNWAKPFQKLGQTSVFRFPIGQNPHILDNFRADPQGVADRFHFEQHYITHSVKRRREVLARGMDAALPAALPADVPAALLHGGAHPCRLQDHHLPRRAQPG